MYRLSSTAYYYYQVLNIDVHARSFQYLVIASQIKTSTEYRTIMEADPEFYLVTCLFCEAGVKKKRFFQHIADNHDVFYNHDLILRITLKGKDSLEHMLKLASKFNQLSVDSISTDKQIKSIVKHSSADSIKKEQEKNDENSILNSQSLSGPLELIKSNKKDRVFNDKVCHERIKTLTLTKNDLSNSVLGEIDNITVVVTQCDKQFSSKYHLKRHKQSHCEENIISCNECSKTFSRNDILKRHKMLHTGIKPFLCQDCDMRFFTNSRLKIHKMLHTGIKPFSCEVCEKSFYTNSKLKRHKHRHSDENVLSCNECTKTFTQIENLKKHKILHTGISKTFSCRDCEKNFFTKKNLKRHKCYIDAKENLTLDESSKKENCFEIRNDINEFIIYDENKYVNIYENSEKDNIMDNENDLIKQENTEKKIDENSFPNIKHNTNKTVLQNNDHCNKDKDIGLFNKSDIGSNVTNKTEDMDNDLTVKVENDGNLLQISKESLKNGKLVKVVSKWNNQFNKCHICQNIFPTDYRLKQHKKESGHKEAGKGRPKKK